MLWSLHLSKRISSSVGTGLKRGRFPFSAGNSRFNHNLSTPARTRFAPSPTGYLHLGSLRTAIFSFLLAKRTGGQFILRIEDTDRKRTVHDAQQRLIEELKWAGIQWDEGPDVGGNHAPYRQSERGHVYRKYAGELVRQTQAYRCFCPPEQASQAGDDGAGVAAKLGKCRSDCRSLPEAESSSRAAGGTPHTVRFAFAGRVPAWNDVVYGKIQPSRNSDHSHVNTLEDTVLIKSDGSPTYHFANVVDDHAMEVTHVIRGTEWMPSTALHVALYKAFGWDAPVFAHVGLLTDKNNNKLSKRNFDTDIRDLRQKHGLLPSAFVNYLASFGWQIPGKKDTKTIDELCRDFSLKFSRGNSIVTLDKLWYLQRQHGLRIVTAARKKGTETGELTILVQYLLQETKERLGTASTDLQRILRSRTLETYLLGILWCDPGNYSSPSQYLDKNAFFFTTQAAVDMPAVEEDAAVLDLIKAFIDHPTVVQSLQLWEDCSDEQGVVHMHGICAAIDEAAQKCTSILSELIVDLARQTGDESPSSERSEDAFKKTAAYKATTATVFHALRRRLMFTDGPGPSATKAMAVLGYDEARRRLLARTSQG